MRILLDESLPLALKDLLVGHEAQTVAGAGWNGIKNGKLLALAATQFDVFITADKNIEFQQNLKTLPVAIMVLQVFNNRIEAVGSLVPNILAALNQFEPKSFSKIALNKSE
jgi:predicted nuclease of predicted toxin-antitoxin system